MRQQRLSEFLGSARFFDEDETPQDGHRTRDGKQRISSDGSWRSRSDSACSGCRSIPSRRQSASAARIHPRGQPTRLLRGLRTQDVDLGCDDRAQPADRAATALHSKAERHAITAPHRPAHRAVSDFLCRLDCLHHHGHSDGRIVYHPPQFTWTQTKEIVGHDPRCSFARIATCACSSHPSLLDPQHHQGGIGSSFVVDPAAELITALFFTALRYDFSDPKRLDNDRFVLSKGHAAPVLAAAWAAAGLISEEDLLSLRRLDSIYEDIRRHAFRGSMWRQDRSDRDLTPSAWLRFEERRQDLGAGCGAVRRWRDGGRLEREAAPVAAAGSFEP